jgi:AraC-like DNA-binding protein
MQLWFAKKALGEMAQKARFRVSIVAKRLHRTPTQIRRQCHRHNGCAPKKLFIHWRLQLAAKLLSAGDPVKSVSTDVGFKHVSSFCRQFKAVYGLRPAEFANKMRNS